MKKLLFLFVFSVQMFAYTPNDILNSINFVAQKEGVKPEILYTIVKIESDFNPFVISFFQHPTTPPPTPRNQRMKLRE